MLAPLAPFASLQNKDHQFHNLPANFNGMASQAGLRGLTNIGGANFAENRHQRDSFEIFNAILQKAYSQILFKPTNQGFTGAQSPQAELAEYAPAGFQSVDRISSQQAAGTILDFITSRIQSDAANGASQEELLTRLDQGLQGFVKGFNEAKDILEGLGLLSPALSEEINDTYATVTGGIEKLREQIMGGADDSSELAEIDHPVALSQIQLASQTSESSSFSLSLTTQDGDRVSIDISRASQSSFSSNFQSNANGSLLSISQQSRSSSSFNLSVTGELDEGELEAINSLLEDVEAIADDFYGGRLDQAFELALELDINREELSTLNLQLQKTTTSQALAAYQTTAQSSLPLDGETQSTPVSPFADLNQLIDILQDLSGKAGKFAEPVRLIEDLLSGVSSVNHQQRDDGTLGETLKELISQFDL